MSSFKIKIEGVELLKKSLNADRALERLIPDISISVLKLHNVLERRVSELFNVPRELDSVRIGHTVGPERQGKTLLRYSLQYRNEYIPLVQYPNTTTPIPSATAKFPLRLANGHVRWKLKGYALETKVAVRKGKSVIATRKQNYTRKGFLQNGRILARKQKATWKTFPSFTSEGERAPYSELFGPSLAHLAMKVYDKDSQVAAAVDTMNNEILDSFVRSYD